MKKGLILMVVGILLIGAGFSIQFSLLNKDKNTSTKGNDKQNKKEEVENVVVPDGVIDINKETAQLKKEHILDDVHTKNIMVIKRDTVFCVTGEGTHSGKEERNILLTFYDENKNVVFSHVCTAVPGYDIYIEYCSKENILHTEDYDLSYVN